MVVRRKRRIVRYGLLTANALLLVAVVAFVVKSPADTAEPSVQQSAVASITDEEQTAVSPLDKVSSADIAVTVARTVGLPETNSVTNHADSINAASATIAADSAVVAKPQVVASALPSKYDIQTYVTKQGDSISSIAAKFGVSSDSIRWSNNLSGDTVAAGTTLVMPPSGVSGLVHKVVAGDTPESLAQKFSTDKQLIVTYNDAELSGLKVGERILIPEGVLTAAAVTPAVRSTYTSTTNFAWGGSSPVYSANGYDYGWCTWHAANRRQQAGNPIPSNLGNAISWYGIAASAGLPVGSQPRAGAVLWHANMGGLGHVAYVEKLNKDGSILVSDMNYPIWGTVTYRTVPASEMGSYRFIY